MTSKPNKAKAAHKTKSVSAGDDAAAGTVIYSVIYEGKRTASGDVTVTRRVEKADGTTTTARPLPPRFDLRNHSPTGFEWGYGGSGPAQLALALLADAVGDQAAMTGSLYQAFKWRIVANLPQVGWTLTRAEVRRVAKELQAEQVTKAAQAQAQQAAAAPAP